MSIQDAANVRSYRVIKRRQCRKIKVGNVEIGGNAEVAVQSMTTTLTTDIKATLEQIRQCVDVGAEIMRVSVPDKESTEALKVICKESPVPIVADVHFHYKRGIEAAQNGAKCLRINPGTIGSKERAREVVKAAKDYGCSVRIGVNAGSLEERILEKYKTPCPEAMVESALDSLKILEDLDFFETKISVKASDIFLAIRSYEKLASVCDYPLHIGITEAGGITSGTVKSSIGLGHLLMSGIGDTIRVSLSAHPKEEIKVIYEMLKALNIRGRGVNLISCPSCARQQFDVIKTVEEVEKRTSHITKAINVSILGCVVNGLGEAAHTHIGLTGAGSGNHLLYIDGKPSLKIKNEEIVDSIVRIIEDKAKTL